MIKFSNQGGFMEQVYFWKIFNLLVGVVGAAIGLGVVLMPQVISRIEQKLDKNFSTEKLEKMLNERRNLSEILLRHPKIFGFIVILLSFLLVASSLFIF